MSTDDIPLHTIFGKAEAESVKVSNGGKWLAWLARSSGKGGVLDLWVAPLPLPSPGPKKEANRIPGARQLTAAEGRDICFSFHFTKDDKRIVYLRETTHGSELYHLYALNPLDDEDAFPMTTGHDLLAKYPSLTCALGFVGGEQLWLPESTPDLVVLATGTGSLMWALSILSLGTSALTGLVRNPCSTILGCARLILVLVFHVVVWSLGAVLGAITCGCITLPTNWLAPPPSAPSQYFVGTNGNVTGRAEVEISLQGIALRLTRRCPRKGSWLQVGPSILFADLNMQLMGSGPATGTLRLDVLDANEGSVAVHTCVSHDTTSYVKYPEGEVLFVDPQADIQTFISNPRSGEVEAVVVTRERSETVALNSPGALRFKHEFERLRDMILGIDGEEGETVMVVSRTMADDLWVMRSHSDTKAQRFFLAQPWSNGVGDHGSPSPVLLLSARPQLASLPLVCTRSVKITARDGVLLSAYLTLPKKGKGRVPLALVLHGGPAARDYAGYVPLLQLLASRHIGSLSVNYRGSTGYGKKFLKLGNGAVQGMNNDVEDARQWAIETGIADPGKIAIMGGSWGGYLALGGATCIAENDEPQKRRYAAVVAIVPPVTVGAADKRKAFRSDPLVKRYWRQIYGPEVSSNKASAERISPLYRLEHLRGNRLLLIHGEDDPRVPREHGDAVAAAARSMGLVGAHLTYAREGHSIRREPNVLHMWSMVMKFLCLQLDLPPPPAVNSQLIEGHTAYMQWASSPNLFEG